MAPRKGCARLFAGKGFLKAVFGCCPAGFFKKKRKLGVCEIKKVEEGMPL